MDKSAPDIVLSPKRTATSLGAAAILLVVLHLAGLANHYVFELDKIAGLERVVNLLQRLVHLDREKNLPTLFSTCLMLINSALMMVIWRMERAQAKPATRWLILVFIFGFLAIDEFTELHEGLIIPLRAVLDTSGIFYFAWIIPYGIAVSLLALAYIPLVFGLDKEIRILVIAAAAIYLGGAIGIEMIGGWYIQVHHGQPDLLYDLITTLEESLEMAGLVLLIYALMSLIQTQYGSLTIGIPPRRTRG